VKAAITVAAAALLAFGTGTPALAAQPTIERIPIEFSFQDQFLTEECGVAVTTTLSGFRIERIFEDGQGRLIAVNTVNVAGSATAEGGSFQFRDVGADVIREAPDGTVTVTLIGQLPFDFTGRLVFDADTGEVVKEPQFGRGTRQLEQACEILRG
jgi:hypothetical protein